MSYHQYFVVTSNSQADDISSANDKRIASLPPRQRDVAKAIQRFASINSPHSKRNGGLNEKRG